MNAVGIDVSKGKSMVTILRPFGEIVSRPHEIQHTTDQVDELVQTIRSLEGETRVVMEYTLTTIHFVRSKLTRRTLRRLLVILLTNGPN